MGETQQRVLAPPHSDQPSFDHYSQLGSEHVDGRSVCLNPCSQRCGFSWQGALDDLMVFLRACVSPQNGPKLEGRRARLLQICVSQSLSSQSAVEILLDKTDPVPRNNFPEKGATESCELPIVTAPGHGGTCLMRVTQAGQPKLRHSSLKKQEQALTVRLLDLESKGKGSSHQTNLAAMLRSYPSDLKTDNLWGRINLYVRQKFLIFHLY